MLSIMSQNCETELEQIKSRVGGGSCTKMQAREAWVGIFFSQRRHRCSNEHLSGAIDDIGQASTELGANRKCLELQAGVSDFQLVRSTCRAVP